MFRAIVIAMTAAIITVTRPAPPLRAQPRLGTPSAAQPSAARSATSFPRHIVQRYTTADGLPGNYVWNMTQGRDGMLWLIAGGVVTRFDGRRFEEVPLPAAPTSAQGGDYAVSLHTLRDTLWVAALSRRMLARAGGRWITAYTTPVTLGELAGRHSLPLFALHWSGAEASVWRDTVALRRYPAFLPREVRPDPQLVVDRDGVLWAADVDRALGFAVGNTTPMQTQGADANTAPNSTIPLVTNAFVRAPDSLAPLGVRRANGMLQVVDRTGRVLRSVADTDGRFPRLLTRDGRLFVASRSALEIYPPTGGPPERIAGNFVRGGDAVSLMLEDREGTVWVATGARGVLMVRPRFIQQAVPRATSSASAPVDDMTQIRSITRMRDGGALLVSNGLFRVAPNSTIPAPLAITGLPRVGTWTAALEDADGALWVSAITPPGDAIFAVRPSGSPSWIVRDDIAAVQLVEDRPRDAMLVLQRDTLTVFSLGAPQRAARDVIALNGWDARHLIVGGDGTRYIGGQRGVLVLPPGVTTDVRAPDAQTTTTGEAASRPASVREYTPDNGYALGGVRALHLDREGALWIGMYGGGLARLHRDSLRILRRANGLAENIVSTILEDDAGTFWMGGNRGVHTLTRAEREAWVHGTRTRVAGVLFDERAGLDNPEGSGWYGTRTANGDLWFPSFGGAIVVSASATASLLPSYGAVTIERIAAGDSIMAVRDTVRLPLGARELTVEVASVSLRAPDVNPLEYRVLRASGDDPSPWTSVDDDRTLRLTALRPGTWRVEVRGAVGTGALGGSASAASSSSEEVVTTASVVLVVPPRFRETPAFRALMTVAFAALLLGGVQLRTRAISQRAATLRDEVEEQTHWLMVEQERTASALERAVETEGRLRELLMSKARSFASLSHELRTPMTLILEPLRELLRDNKPQLPAEGQQRLDTLNSGVQRLERLTAQFLDLADTQSGTLRMQKRVVNFSEFLQGAVAHMEPIAVRKQVHLTVDVPHDMPVSARIDPDHMDKVVTNLLSNAIRHAPNGGTVGVRLWREEGDEPQLVFEVRDNGPGIADDVAHQVFDPFYQGPNATEGMGLGLALTRDVVVQHGGRIELVSEAVEGAVFRVTLPRVTTGATNGAGVEAAPAVTPSGVSPSTNDVTAPATDARDASTSIASTSASDRALAEEMLGGPSVRVLVVEDDYDLREFLRARLGTRHDVRLAESGEDALAQLREWTPDAIVSDIIMPGIDGLALCRILKADPATRNLPIILLTAKGSSEDQERGLMVGADEYLVKPVDVKQLALRIENLVRLKRSIEQRFRDTMPGWASVLMRAGTEALDRDAEQFIARLYRLIVERMGDGALDMDGMARALSMSRSSLYRRVRELLGCSPHDLLTEIRLEQAALLLRTTDQTIGSVALRVGFRTPSHFTRRFVAHFAMNPGEYRRRMKGG